MDDLRLCDSDYRFMCVVWESAPLPSGELVKLCAGQLGWKKSTTYTVLRKLCERGLVKNEDSTVSALIPKEQVQVYQSESFVDRVFDGSLPQFLTAFLGGKTISQQEAAEIRKIIDKYSERR